jgi:hypothetical protein
MVEVYSVLDLPPRLRDKIAVEPNSNHWIWLAATSRGERCGGYGSAYDRGSMRQAHRVVWETLEGPIPDETPVLDHTCKCIVCVHPLHLEPVTRALNNSRSSCWRHPAFLARHTRKAA